MTTISNPNSGFDQYLNLQPPGKEGEAFTQLATNIKGVPIGEEESAGSTISKLLGYSDKDTIGSANLEEILNSASKLNVTALSSFGAMEEVLQEYLDNLDPTSPSLPPIKALLAICQKALQQGKIGGLELSNKSERLKNDQEEIIETGEITADSTLKDAGSILRDIEDDTVIVDTEIKDDFKVTVPSEKSGNPWLSGHAYVAFLVEFMQMQRLMMQNKSIQLKNELMALEVIVDLAVTSAELTMKIAKENQMIHIVTAVMSGVALFVSALSVRAAIANPLQATTAATIGQMGGQLEKLATSATQAATDITIAEKEGVKQMLDAYKEVMRRQLEKSGEAYKASEDLIMQLIQALDKIREGLQQAVAASLRK